jgi:hypothetical protein
MEGQHLPQTSEMRLLLKLYLYPTVFGAGLYLFVVAIAAPIRHYIHRNH